MMQTRIHPPWTATPPKIIKTQAHFIVWNMDKKEYRSAPKNNNSLLLQSKKQGILKGTKKKASPS